jgi:hypothetical protein
MTKPLKAPVSERALLQRINRKLKPDLEAVKKTRGGWRRLSDLGDYYWVDYRRNFMLNHHLDLETVGHELGVLEEWEMVSEQQ